MNMTPLLVTSQLPLNWPIPSDLSEKSGGQCIEATVYSKSNTVEELKKKGHPLFLNDRGDLVPKLLQD